MRRNLKKAILLTLVVLLLIACGGGDSSSSLGELGKTGDSDGGGESGGGSVGGSIAGSDWGTGISTDPLILRENPLFEFQLFSSPAIADETIYVGSTDGALYALDLNGTVKWTYQTGDQIVASPAIGSDGTVYIGSADRQLYAINPDGSLKWVCPTKVILASSPAIGSDGTIYVAGTQLDGTFICGDSPNPVQLGCFYAVNPDGTLKWSVILSGPVNSSPVIASDGTIYIGSAGDVRPIPKIEPFGLPSPRPEISFDRIDPCDPTTIIPPSDADPSYPVNGHVYAINPDGTIKWDFKTLGNVDSSAAVAADGTVYIGSDSQAYAYKGGDTTDVVEIGSLTTGFLYAIDPDGVLIWITDLYGNVKSSPAIGSDGTIYVGTDKEDVFALNDDGTIKWVFPTRGPVRSSPALDMDGTIFVGSNDSRLYALNSDGSLNFEFFANAAIASSPSITANGMVYFATGMPASDDPFVKVDATVYSVVGTTGLADSDWPKFSYNLLNTGRQ